MNNSVYIRSESHEIDSLARRQVPSALPSAWEHRETTGRDYGVDMIVELFQTGNATGLYLLLQIKGTSKRIDDNSDDLLFDIPVKTLKYSELFIVPVLLALCPVQNNPPVFYYLWLQEYIRVVLNFENPTWRNNRTTARLRIPTHNKLPSNEAKILFIANFPLRLFGLSTLGRLLDEINHVLYGPWDQEHFKKTLSFLNKVRDLQGVFDGTWPWATGYRQEYIEPTIKIINAFLENRPFTEDEKRSLLFADFLKDTSTNFAVINQIKHTINILPLVFDETNYSQKNIKWQYGVDIGF